MKNFIILLTVLIGLTSCSKTDAIIPAENVTPIDTTITYYFNVEIPYYNINLINLQPYKHGTIVGEHDELIGKVYYYRDAATNSDYTVFFEYTDGITRISGNLYDTNGHKHAFGTMIDMKHINVCGGPQGIDIFYEISTIKTIITH